VLQRERHPGEAEHLNHQQHRDTELIVEAVYANDVLGRQVVDQTSDVIGQVIEYDPVAVLHQHDGERRGQDG
jgi:hypothetical protein